MSAIKEMDGANVWINVDIIRKNGGQIGIDQPMTLVNNFNSIFLCICGWLKVEIAYITVNMY